MHNRYPISKLNLLKYFVDDGAEIDLSLGPTENPAPEDLHCTESSGHDLQGQI